MKAATAARKTNVVIAQRNLTWNELAEQYEKFTGLKARLQPNNTIFNWALSQKDKFYVDEEGSLHLLVTKTNGPEGPLVSSQRRG
jgi:hypothetical protein